MKNLIIAFFCFLIYFPTVAQLQLSPSPVTGEILLSSAQSYIYLTNSSLSQISTSLSLQSNTQGVSISLNRCSTIGSNKTCYIVLSFPNYAKNSSDVTLSLNNGLSSLTNLKFKAQTLPPEVSNFNGSSLSFNDFSNQSIVISNKTRSIKSYNPIFSGTDASKFSIVLNRCSSVPVGGTCLVYFKLAPQLAGSYSASILEPQVTGSVALSSTITSLTVGVIQPPNPSITISPTSLSFGTITQLGPTSAKSISITNNGNVAVSPIVSLAGSGLELVLNRCLVLLSPNQSCSVSFLFKVTSSMTNGVQSGLLIDAQATSATAILTSSVSASLNIAPSLLSSGGGSSGGVLSFDLAKSQKIDIFLDPVMIGTDYTDWSAVENNYSFLILPDYSTTPSSNVGSGLSSSLVASSYSTSLDKPLIDAQNNQVNFEAFFNQSLITNQCSEVLSLSTCSPQILTDSKRAVISIYKNLINSSITALNFLTSIGTANLPISFHNVDIVLDNNGIPLDDCNGLYISKSLSDKSLFVSGYYDNTGVCQSIIEAKSDGYANLYQDDSALSLDNDYLTHIIGQIGSNLYYFHVRENNFGVFVFINKVDLNTYSIQRLTAIVQSDTLSTSSVRYYDEKTSYILGTDIFTVMRNSANSQRLAKLDTVNNTMNIISDIDVSSINMSFVGDVGGEVYVTLNTSLYKITQSGDVLKVMDNLDNLNSVVRFSKNSNGALLSYDGKFFRISNSGDLTLIQTSLEVGQIVMDVSKSQSLANDKSYFFARNGADLYHGTIYSIDSSNVIKKIYTIDNFGSLYLNSYFSQDRGSKFQVVSDSLYFIAEEAFFGGFLYKVVESSSDQGTYLQKIIPARELFSRDNGNSLYIMNQDTSQILHIKTN